MFFIFLLQTDKSCHAEVDLLFFNFYAFLASKLDLFVVGNFLFWWERWIRLVIYHSHACSMLVLLIIFQNVSMKKFCINSLKIKKKKYSSFDKWHHLFAIATSILNHFQIILRTRIYFYHFPLRLTKEKSSHFQSKCLKIYLRHRQGRVKSFKSFIIVNFSCFHFHEKSWNFLVIYELDF